MTEENNKLTEAMKNVDEYEVEIVDNLAAVDKALSEAVSKSATISPAQEVGFNLTALHGTSKHTNETYEELEIAMLHLHEKRKMLIERANLLVNELRNCNKAITTLSKCMEDLQNDK